MVKCNEIYKINKCKPGLKGSIIILKTEYGMQKKNLKKKYQKLFDDGKLETENLSLSFDSNTQNSKGIREGLLKIFCSCNLLWTSLQTGF